jgi:hypothetical protein
VGRVGLPDGAAKAERVSATVFMNHYPDGPLTNLTSGGNSPGWVDDVSSLVQRKNGQDQEYIMPPLPGLYGAYGAFFARPSVPANANSVIKLNKLKRPTVLGYM